MQTVGEFLREERLKKSLAIKDVESAISIRALYLNAIEEGNYDIIPGEVYVKGFIRNYATFLGLDPQTAIELYRGNKEEIKASSEPAESQQEAIPARPARPPVKPPAHSGGRGWQKGLTVAILAAIAIAGAAWWASDRQQTAPVPPSAAVQPGQQAKGSQGSQATPAVPPANAAVKVSLTAKYTAPCWTQIIADGKEIYEGTPKAGESVTWEATNKLSIKVGNAGVVELLYNGSPVGKIGGNGEVVVKTFTQTGITQ